MTTRIEIDIVVPPGLTTPVPFDAYAKAGMETAVELVRQAGEANLSGGRVRPSGKPRRSAKPGYGPLAGSLTKEVIAPPGAGSAGYIRTNVFYGRFLEYGTKAHRITRRSRRGGRRMLAFGPAQAPTFRRQVQHPGVRGRFWMRSAAEASTPGVVAAFEREAHRWADAVSAGGGAPRA
jgi:hypothetical protein